MGSVVEERVVIDSSIPQDIVEGIFANDRRRIRVRKRVARRDDGLSRMEEEPTRARILPGYHESEEEVGDGIDLTVRFGGCESAEL